MEQHFNSSITYTYCKVNTAAIDKYRLFKFMRKILRMSLRLHHVLTEWKHKFRITFLGLQTLFQFLI